MLTNLPTGRVTTALRMMSVEAQLSQQKLADKVGMSQSAMARRLSGHTPIDLPNLDEIATALGYTVSITFSPVSAPSPGADAGAPSPTHGAPALPQDAG